MTLATQLRDSYQELIRLAGWLDGSTTLCGADLSVRHAHALMMLAQASAPPSLGELGNQLGIDKSNATRLCAELLDHGWVEMQRCREDARVRRVRLTRGGKRLTGELDARSLQFFSRVLENVPSVRDRGAVVRGLPALVRALRSCVAEEESDYEANDTVTSIRVGRVSGAAASR